MRENFSSIVDKLTEFLEVKAEQLKIRLISGGAGLIAFILTMIITSILTIFSFIFLGIALAELLNHLLKSPFLGYFIIAGLFLLCAILFGALFKSHRLKSWIVRLLTEINNANDQD